MKLFRCSSLHKLIGDGRSKAAVISDTAKSAIRDIVKEDLYGFRSFTGNQYTQKGNLLEDLAIEMSGEMRFRNYQELEIGMAFLVILAMLVVMTW